MKTTKTMEMIKMKMTETIKMKPEMIKMKMTETIKMKTTETIKMMPEMKMTETIKMKMMVMIKTKVMMEMIKMMISFKQNNPSKLNSCLKNTDLFVKYSL